MSKQKYSNIYSLFFGILCLAIVYLHSGWIRGFDIYTFDSNAEWLRKPVSMLLMSVVPAFFLLWGYLSNKYLQPGVNQFSLRNKIIQFYPLYLLIFVLHQIINLKNIGNYAILELIGGLLGVYYRPGFYGGNIYLVVISVLMTISILRLIPFDFRKRNVCFTVLALVVTKILPHEASLCYVKYFGYYCAFFVGVVLKDFSFFEILNANAKYLFLLLLIAIIVPLLNLCGFHFLEIQYLPNSPEHLLFTVAFTAFSLKSIEYARAKSSLYFLGSILNRIGNAAYFHFMVHALVIHLLTHLLRMLILSDTIIQVFVICFTSIITIYIVYPTYNACFSLIKLKIQA